MSSQSENSLQEQETLYLESTGPTIERYVRVNATANSKGVVVDSTVSIRFTSPYAGPGKVDRTIMEYELNELQVIANDHLKRRIAELEAEGYAKG
jgi:PHD/YefM family antitoxin component YafN of YafNO toxin-antitoxin module